MSISVVGADVRFNRGRGRCPLAGYRRLLRPFKSVSPSASGSHPHPELAGGGDGDLKPVVDRRASSASLLRYPVVDSSIARRQPWPLSYFRILYRRWHMRRRLRSAKQSRTKGLITHYSRGRKASVRPIASCLDPPVSTVYSSSGSNSVNLTSLGYDSVADRVVCSDEAWQSFIKMHPECRHLRYEGLRHKELQYNVFEKTHAAGAYGYGSVTMGDGSSPSIDYEFNFANSETHPCLEEDLTPTGGGRHADTRQGPDRAGPSLRSGSLCKRKQRDATEEMAYSAMQEVRDYFRGISQTGGGSEQSVQNGGLVQCMNIMKGMGFSTHHQMMMWHYFDSHPHLMGPFCQVDDDLRRAIIGSVINPQPSPAI
ncbi:hypothetical protein TIFTF001_029870 [Ficus carica]|uniref:Uncharacterized protein n=1 Tax=Ficus carica TaxID=3494 RepID=A0AA88J435_FICCA|nr:hypothetical protein TIFTF001_029870 [Ficus carica]